MINCTTDIVSIPEIIQTPVDLQIVALGSGIYEISFKSDNRENGFSGYGIFVGDSREVVLTEPPPSLGDYFCSMISGQIPYTARIKIITGTSYQQDYLCSLANLTLSSGQFVAVRARVERETAPWSRPVIAQVP